MTRCLYSGEELAYRPIEHILEALPRREVVRYLGCGHDTAWRIRKGRRVLTREEEERLRAGLKREAEL